MFRAALRWLLAAALCAAPSVVRADTYRWVDEGGVTHYSTSRDEIPRRYRDAAQVIVPAPSAITNPSGARPPAPPARPPETRPPQAEPVQTEPAPPVEAAPPASAPEPESPAPVPQGAPAESRSTAPPAQPAPPAEPVTHARASGDPRADEIAELEGQIERDRETLRQLISTPRWDSTELASDARVREIAERLPRLQAELAALRTEAGH